MSNRPSHNAEEVIDEAVSKLLPKVMNWFKECGDGDDENDVRKQLAKEIRFYDDGYEIARNLENEGWRPDAALVDILDNVSHEKFEAHILAVEAWVNESSVQLSFPVGASVTTKYGDGVIVDHWPKTAQYIVQTNDRTWTGPKTGYVLSAEDCAPVDG